MQVRLLGSVDVTVGGVARPVAGLRTQGRTGGARVGRGRDREHRSSHRRRLGREGTRDGPNALQSHMSYLRGVLGNRTAIAARAHGYVLDRYPYPVELSCL